MIKNLIVIECKTNVPTIRHFVDLTPEICKFYIKDNIFNIEITGEFKDVKFSDFKKVTHGLYKEDKTTTNYFDQENVKLEYPIITQPDYDLNYLFNFDNISLYFEKQSKNSNLYMLEIEFKNVLEILQQKRGFN